MPTARELLEQADALMRRNRANPLSEDIPVLTDVVEEAPRAKPTLVKSEPPPKTIEVDEEEEIKELPATPAYEVEELSTIPQSAVPPDILTNGERAQNAALKDLTEQVYAQVLQNLDLYTERALQQHLSVYLQPIVERVGQDVLQAVTANVGKLLREYIAQAIEKDIAQMQRNQAKE